MRFETLSLTSHTPDQSDLAPILEEALGRSVVIHVTNAATFSDPLAFWEKVIREIGEFAAVGEEPSGEKADRKSIWMDVRFDPRHNQSFRHFNSAQPLHTDGAY